MTDPRKAGRRKREHARFAALGRFVVAYSGVETAVHVLGRHLSGAADEKARVIFEWMSLEQLMQRISRLLDLSDAAEADLATVSACFSQVRLLAELRNSVVHGMLMTTDDGIRVSNLFTSRFADDIKEAEFTLSDLDKMHSDCKTIYLRLGLLVMPPGLLRLSRAAHAKLLEPWQYKQPGQPPRN